MSVNQSDSMPTTGNAVSAYLTASAAEASEVSEALYAARQKIYPRAVTGMFASFRVAAVLSTQLLFYGLPWLTWDNRQAVLFDLLARKFYIFGLVLWPQDFIYLTALLIIAALSLFLFTAVAGRLWCGFTCPQTVYTEIFLWIERKIEGDRHRQIKLDKEPWSLRKLSIRSAKHGAWIALSFWTGFTFVGYFTPIHTLAGNFISFNLGPWETFWIFFYAFATYGNAGWMREQVCLHMCPYARFQSVMFDADTLIITYDAKRGEPRGARSKFSNRTAAGLGDCINCSICVQACPTGIDIRHGLQYQCIGCTACIDACNHVMDKMGYPRGLIRYSTENALQGKYAGQNVLKYLFRPRVVIYSIILLGVIAALAGALYLRQPLQINVMRDRLMLARETDDGLIENMYRLQIINMDEKPHRYQLSATGVNNLRLLAEEQSLDIAALSSRTVSVRLQGDPKELHDIRRSVPIEFQVRAIDKPDQQRATRSRFLTK